MGSAGSYRFVSCLWDAEKARAMTGLDRLVYRSNCLGADQRITNTGGGNTSSKLTESDPLTGQPTDVLWVKGSGGDLRTADRSLFASLYQNKVLALRTMYERGGADPALPAARSGVKTPIEDAMVAMYPHCAFGLNPRASSIDTPLHAFVDARHVDHTHPNAVIAIAACARGPEVTREVYGDDVVWTDWQRPGFDLGLKLAHVQRSHPKARGVILGQHGLINWADDDQQCYFLSLDLIERAAQYLHSRDRGDQTFGGARYAPLPYDRRDDVLVALLPWLRGRLTHGAANPGSNNPDAYPRQIATVQHDDAMLRFVCSADAPRLAEMGTSCPDHFLRTKIKPLYVPWDPNSSAGIDGLKLALDDALAAYRRDYAAYYHKCKRSDSPAMRNPNPTVVLIPGLGMIAWGKNKSESRVTAEFYSCAVEVMRGAESCGGYVALDPQEAFDIEYWLLEEAKLKRMPPEKPLSGRVTLLIGAASGIGRAAGPALAALGSHVVCADFDHSGAEAAANEITARHGPGIGVAGSGISRCGPAVAAKIDVTDRASVRSAIRSAVLAFGGIDDAIITAGIFPTPDASGRLDDSAWAKAFAVNVTGVHTVADEARAVWSAQGLTGSLVVTTSVNAVVSKKGSLAYDTSKAAANHLVRELAVELAPLVRVNAVAPATVIGGSSMFPRDRVLASLAKYSIAHSPDEPTDSLISKLAAFYASRTLLKKPVTTRDQVNAIITLVTDALEKTTGQVLTVDAGLVDAFLR